jgi:hypothetical protein
MAWLSFGLLSLVAKDYESATHTTGAHKAHGFSQNTVYPYESPPPRL